MSLFSVLATLGAILVINSFFSVLPWLLPRLDTTDLLPYQLWINALILFYFILPSQLGGFY